MSSSNAEGPVAPRPVEYVDYDVNYPSVFELLERLLQSVLPGRRVEHIGSTSVPGLGGRPVLDSVVVAPRDEHASIVESLEGVGFEAFPHGAVRPGLTRSLRVARGNYPVVVYVVAPDHDYLRGWLAFTSYMREHPDAVERYAAVKRAALAEGHTDPRAYQEAKTPFLVQLMRMSHVSANSSIESVSLTAAESSFLLSVDSPTLANAIEHFQVRDRCDGYLGGSIRAQFPDLGVMVGQAVTVTMTSVPGPAPSSDGLWRMWEALERAPKPAVLVIQDVSGAPSRCAYIGEIMSTLALRLGAVGAVTDGGVRDLAEVRALGFHYFAPYPVVSHGNFDVVDVGVPVTLDGQVVQAGDILHGDRNGIVLVPADVLSGLPAAVERIRTSERARLDTITAPEFTLAAYRRASTATY